jgi:flagellar M-ring protein FliF
MASSPGWLASLRVQVARLFTRGGGETPAAPAAFLQNLLPLVLLTAGITALVLMYLWRDQASYKPLFGAREKVNAAEMMAALDAAGISYRVHPQSGQVLVPDSQLGKARMALASKGVVPQSPAGLELLEHNDPLGVSQFVQDVRFRRGLEGELAQSIMTLDAVDSARVHLSIARSSSFVVSEGEKSSASVMLVLKPGHELGHEQIAAIMKLVVGSVAGLDPQQVTVVDQTGDLLSARVDLTDGYDSLQGSDASHYYQDQTRRNIGDLLAPVLGASNYHASVTAEVDNDRVQETHERYGDAPKVTNEALREELDHDPLALGVPGSLSNRPIAVAGAAALAANAAAAAPNAAANPPATASGDPATAAPAVAPAESSTAKKNAATRQYAYDRSVTQIQRSRGRLHKLNVAVVLNAAAAPGGKGVWSAQDLTNIERILRSGLGIDATRGDTLVVSTLDFPKPTVVPTGWRDPENVVDAARWLAYPCAAFLGWLLIFRPLLKIAQQRLAVPATPTALPMSVDTAPVGLGAARMRGANAAPLPGQAVKAETAIPVSPLLENYDLPPPGSPVDVMVDHLKVLAAKEPERVAEVVKQWVQKSVRTQ